MKAPTVRWLFAALGVGTATAFFLLVDLEGIVAGRLTLGALLPIAVWSGPFVLFPFTVRSARMSALGGVSLNVVSLVALLMLFTGTGSTTGVGLAAYPGGLLFLVGMFSVFDSMDHTRRSR